MESIGLFEAKTHLSELVARAERGEEVIITRHQRPVAKLVPIEPSAPAGRQRRVAALKALETFDRIALPGVELGELIRAGRR